MVRPPECRGTLDAEDWDRANRRAVAWIERVYREGLGPGHGERVRDPSHENRHKLVGALGEVAYAKHYGLPLPGRDEFGAGDFGNIQVRSTTHPRGHLIVFDSEPMQGRTFVLVVLYPAMGYRIVGEIDGPLVPLAGFRPRNLRAGSPPQWWVPQGELDPHRPATCAP